MSKDFYSILGLDKRKATQQDVYKAYCKMSIRWHPEKPENKGDATAKSRFSDIAEAYTVLIDDKKREEFDKTGSYTIPEYQGVQAYHSAQTLYKTVFGGVGLNEDGRAPEKQPSIIRDLAVGLEEMYTGTTKKLKITRKVLDPKDYARTIDESSVIEVTIKPGWKVRSVFCVLLFPSHSFEKNTTKAGTKITFERMGDEKPGEVAADMVFVLSQKPHPLFERQGNHLLFKTVVRLREALVGGEVRLKTLDDRPLKIAFKGPIKPGHQQTVAGEGMIDSKATKQKEIECRFFSFCSTDWQKGRFDHRVRRGVARRDLRRSAREARRNRLLSTVVYKAKKKQVFITH